MSRYPRDPNSLINEVRSMNETAKQLREEGWTVRLNAAEDGSRVWLEISTVRACDPAQPEPVA